MSHNLISLIGRLLLGFIFLGSAFNKLGNFSGTASYMESAGMPATGFFLSGAIAFLLAGSISIMAGIYPRVGAVLLLIFLIPTTLIFHPPGDPDEQIAMMKNLAIMGGLLGLLAHGGGAWGLDRFLPACRGKG